MYRHEDPIEDSSISQILNYIDPDSYLDDLLSSIRAYANHDLPNYTKILKAAFISCEPVFARKQYGEFFWKCASTIPGWLPQVVLANANAESEGASKLHTIYRSHGKHSSVSEAILHHAGDEVRHSKLFLALTRFAFPNILEDSVHDKIKSSLFKIPKDCDISPQQHDFDKLIDEMAQINIGEIRTRLHMFLLAPVIFSLTPVTQKEAVYRILDGLVQDEIKHIGYTAGIMEEWCSEDFRIIDRTYLYRLKEFNQITIDQTFRSMAEYKMHITPGLLEI